jgi:hypothetical protein
MQNPLMDPRIMALELRLCSPRSDRSLKLMRNGWFHYSDGNFGLEDRGYIVIQRLRNGLRKTISMNRKQRKDLSSQTDGFVRQVRKTARVSIAPHCDDRDGLEKLSHVID